MRDTTKGSGGRWAVILGLAFIAALGISVLVLWPGMKPAEGGNPAGFPLPLPQEPTARQAYRAAQEAARAWQTDAQPATLAAHWRQTRGRWPSQSTWTVQFYSPATGRMAVVVVEAGRARLLQETITPYPLPTWAEDRWRVDSPQALEVWWAEGGADFLARHPQAEVAIQLGPAGPADPRPVWTVTAVAGNQVHTLSISGVDGRQQ